MKKHDFAFMILIGLLIAVISVEILCLYINILMGIQMTKVFFTAGLSALVIIFVLIIQRLILLGLIFRK